MRLLLIGFVALFFCASLASGQGFFDSVRNFFNRPRRQPQFNQQSQFNQQQPQPQFNQQQPQFNQQQQPQFTQQSQQFQPQNQGFQQQQQPQNQAFQPQGQRFQPQNQGFQQTRNQGFQQNRNPSFQPPRNQGLGQNNQANNNNNNQGGLVYRTCAVPEPASFCPKAPANHFYNGKNYLLTWNISCTNCECEKFTAEEADDYCRSMGARAVSLDTDQKARHFIGVSAQWAKRYYWTGGRINYPNDQVVQWPSGRATPVGPKGQGFWSEKGATAASQPDNRNFVIDKCEPEFCVAVLNNFYNDGIKWHDVACHHKKPTICEFP